MERIKRVKRINWKRLNVVLAIGGVVGLTILAIPTRWVVWFDSLNYYPVIIGLVFFNMLLLAFLMFRPRRA